MQRSSSQQLRQLLSNKRAVLFDCDGVLWHGSALIDGAQQLVAKLQSMQKRVLFVTNNSAKSRDDYVQKCQQLGLAAARADIVCTASAAADHLQRTLPPGRKAYVIGSSGLRRELDSRGVAYCGFGEDDGADFGEGFDSYMGLRLDPDVAAVLFAFDAKINYVKLVKAASYVARGAEFVASNEDAALPCRDTAVLVPGTGALLASLKVATGRQPLVVGKPHSPMLQAAVASFDEADEAPAPPLADWLMVGDNLHTDILFGRRHGVDTVCVLSGVATEADIAGLPPDSELRPTAVTDSVMDLLRALS